MRFATWADASHIERICNEPLMRVWSAFDGAPPMSANKYLTAPSFCIVGDEGCMLVQHIEGERFVLHVNLLPHCRGLAAIRAGLQAMDLAFARPQVGEMVAAIPACIPQSIWLARRFGFKFVRDLKSQWPVGQFRFPVRCFVLKREDWSAARLRVIEEGSIERKCHA